MAAASLGGKERMEPIASAWLLMFINQKEKRNRIHGSGEVAQWLATLSFLAVDPSSIPSTHTAAHGRLKLHSQGIWQVCCRLLRQQACSQCIYIHAGKTLPHTLKIKSKQAREKRSEKEENQSIKH